MRKLILIFIFTIFFSGVASAKSVEFSVVSNAGVQTDTSVKDAQKLTPSIKKLMDSIDLINKNGSEFTIFLGDNLAAANKYNLVMFSKITRELEKPVYVAIGDKDVAQTKNLDKKEYYRILNLFSKNRIKKLPEAKKINGFVFVFMDGVNQFIPTQYGYYRESELAELDIILKKYKNDPVVIIGHYPIYSSDEIKETILPHNIESFYNTLSKHKNVIAVVSGHHNIDDEYTKDGIYNISVQSLDKNSEFKKIYIDYTDRAKFTFVKTRVYKVE